KGGPKGRPRLAEAVEQALALGEGSLIVAVEEGEREAQSAQRTQERETGEAARSALRASRSTDTLLSARYACTYCDRSYEPPSPQLFSFNSPQGMCLDCDGLGTRYDFAPELLIPDPSLSFHAGAIPLVGNLREMGRWRRHIYEGVARSLGIDLKTPWQGLPEEARNALLHGAGEKHITFEWKQRGGSTWKHGGKWEGVVPQLLA